MKRKILCLLVFVFVIFGSAAPGGFDHGLCCAQAHAAMIGPAQFENHAEDTVYFNTVSKKFHRMDCHWAIMCTRNCIAISRAEAVRRGGVPCKVCGGGM
jgi:hypothetical protein